MMYFLISEKEKQEAVLEHFRATSINILISKATYMFLGFRILNLKRH